MARASCDTSIHISPSFGARLSVLVEIGRSLYRLTLVLFCYYQLTRMQWMMMTATLSDDQPDTSRAYSALRLRPPWKTLHYRRSSRRHRRIHCNAAQCGCLLLILHRLVPPAGCSERGPKRPMDCGCFGNLTAVHGTKAVLREGVILAAQ